MDNDGDDIWPPRALIGKPLRRLDALRERLRLMHYSLRSEEANVYWAPGICAGPACGVRATSAPATVHG